MMLLMIACCTAEMLVQVLKSMLGQPTVLPPEVKSKSVKQTLLSCKSRCRHLVCKCAPDAVRQETLGPED